MAEEKLGVLFYDLQMKKKGFDRALREAIKEMRQLGLIERDLGKTGTEAGKGADQAGKGVDNLGKQAKKAHTPMKSLLARMRQFLVVVGTFIVLRRAVKFLLEFEKRMAEISTISGESASKLSQLRDGILEISRVLPLGPSDVAAGAYQTLSAGITDSADALQVLRAASTAAVAGLSDTRSAVDAITTVLNAFQFSADQASHVADVLFKTVELGKVTFPELSQNIGNVATSASLAGVSIEETTAAIATLTKFGIGAAEATTSLNRLFLTLTSQSDDQANAFRRLGVEFNTSTVKEKGFIGLIQELNKLTDEQIEKLSELFPNIRAARAAFVLAGKGTAEYVKLLAQTENAQGAADRAAKKMSQTFGSQAKLFANNVNIVLQDLASKILPSLARALEQFNRLFMSDAERRIEAYERLGAVELALGVRRTELLRQSQEQLDELQNRAQDFVETLAGAPEAGLPMRLANQLGIAIPVLDQEAGFVDKERLKAQTEIVGALKEAGEVYKEQKSISATILELERRSSDATGRRLEVLGAITDRLRDAEVDEREFVRLQLLINDLTDEEYQRRQKQLRWYQTQLDIARRLKDAERERNLELKIAEIRLQNQVHEMRNFIRVQELAVPQELRFLPAENVGDVEASIRRLEYALAGIEQQEADLRASADQLDESDQRKIKNLDSQHREIKTLLSVYEQLLEMLKQLNAVQEGDNDALQATTVLTDEQIKAIRNLNKALAQAGPTTAAKKSLLEEMKFEDAVRAIATAFTVQLPEDIETGSKRMGENFEQWFGEAINKVPDEVREMLHRLRKIMVEDFDPVAETLGKQLQEAIDKVKVKEFKPGEEVIADALKFERALATLYEGAENIPEEYRQKVEELKGLLRTAAIDELQRDLEDRLSKLTETAAQASLSGFDRYIAEFVRKAGEIPDELKPMIEKIRAALLDAVAVEGISNELDKLQTELKTRLAKVEAGTGTQTEKEEARRQIYEDILERAQALQFLIGETVTDEDERAKLEAAIAKWIAEQRADMGNELSTARRLAREANRRLRNTQAIVGLINQAVEGMTSFLEAVGAVDETFVKMINSLRQIGVGIATMQSGLDALDKLQEAKANLDKIGESAEDIIDMGVAIGSIAAGGIGIIGGISSLISGLGGGETETQKIQKANIKALEDLRNSLDKLRGTLSITGADYANATRAFETTLARLGGRQAFTLDPVGFRKMRETLQEELTKLGLSFTDLDDIAKELGITIRDSEGNITAAGLNDLIKALDEFGKYLIGFPDTIAGALDELQVRFDIFDVDNPLDQLELMQQALNDFTAGAAPQVLLDEAAAIQAQIDDLRKQAESADFTRRLQINSAITALEQRLAELNAQIDTFGEGFRDLPAFDELLGLDVRDPEQRKIMEELIKGLFEDLAAGLITPEQLGATTFEEAIAILQKMEGLLDNIDENTGQTQNVLRSVSITELQANQLLAYQATMATIQARMERVLTDIYNLMLSSQIIGLNPPPVANLATTNPLTGQPVNVEVDVSIGTIVLGQGATEEQARSFVDNMSEEVRRKLGEELKAIRQRYGELN